MHEQNENLKKDRNLEKYKREVTEMKNKITELKNSMVGFNQTRSSGGKGG